MGSGQGEARTLAAIMIHPAYNKRNLNSDVAVLKLSAPILTVAPAAVVGANDNSFEWAGTGLTVVGWGNTIPAKLHRHKAHYPERQKERPFLSSATPTAPRSGTRRVQEGSESTLLVCTTARRFGAGDSGSPSSAP